MNDPSRGINTRSIHYGASFDIHFQEVGCRHFLEQHAKWNKQEPVVAARQTCGKMSENQIVHTPSGEDPVTGGKLQPYMSFKCCQRVWAALVKSHPLVQLHFGGHRG